jgi:crystallin alpha B
MSVVPLSFRDWWNDWDSSFRSSRLLDQEFGTGLRRDDLLSSFWNPTPSVSRSGYVRPWRANTTLERQTSGSTLNVEDDKFQVILDVQQFAPNEITVKTTDKYIIVEGKHEEKADEHGYISRQFTRRYQLPPGSNPNDVQSSLSSDGVLTITSPRKPPAPVNTERVVPITQTGPTKTEESTAKVE